MANEIDGINKRQIIRFDPQVSMGTIIQMIGLLLVAAGAWATYQSDKATMRLELDQIKSAAAAEKNTSKESLQELKNDVKSIQATVQQMDKTLAIIQANQPKAQR